MNSITPVMRGLVHDFSWHQGRFRKGQPLKVQLLCNTTKHQCQRVLPKAWCGGQAANNNRTNPLIDANKPALLRENTEKITLQAGPIKFRGVGHDEPPAMICTMAHVKVRCHKAASTMENVLQSLLYSQPWPSGSWADIHSMKSLRRRRAEIF